MGEGIRLEPSTDCVATTITDKIWKRTWSVFLCFVKQYCTSTQSDSFNDLLASVLARWKQINFEINYTQVISWVPLAFLSKIRLEHLDIRHIWEKKTTLQPDGFIRQVKTTALKFITHGDNSKDVQKKTTLIWRYIITYFMLLSLRASFNISLKGGVNLSILAVCRSQWNIINQLSIY